MRVFKKSLSPLFEGANELNVHFPAFLDARKRCCDLIAFNMMQKISRSVRNSVFLCSHFPIKKVSFVFLLKPIFNMLRAVGITGLATVASAVNESNKRGIPLMELPFSDAISPFTEVYCMAMGIPFVKPLTTKQAVEIVNTFHARQYVPIDGWFGLEKNGHWQTIVGTGSLHKMITKTELKRNFIRNVKEFIHLMVIFLI